MNSSTRYRLFRERRTAPVFPISSVPSILKLALIDHFVEVESCLYLCASDTRFRPQLPIARDDKRASVSKISREEEESSEVTPARRNKTDQKRTSCTCVTDHSTEGFLSHFSSVMITPEKNSAPIIEV
jgi:hypothetical protein